MVSGGGGGGGGDEGGGGGGGGGREGKSDVSHDGLLRAVPWQIDPAAAQQWVLAHGNSGLIQHTAAEVLTWTWHISRRGTPTRPYRRTIAHEPIGATS